MRLSRHSDQRGARLRPPSRHALRRDNPPPIGPSLVKTSTTLACDRPPAFIAAMLGEGCQLTRQRIALALAPLQGNQSRRASCDTGFGRAVAGIAGPFAAAKAFPFHIRAHVFQTFFLVVRLCEIPFVVSRNLLAVFLTPRCSAFSGARHALAAICSSGRNVPVAARFAGEVQPSSIRLRGFARHLAHAAGSHEMRLLLLGDLHLVHV